MIPLKGYTYFYTIWTNQKQPMAKTYAGNTIMGVLDPCSCIYVFFLLALRPFREHPPISWTENDILNNNKHVLEKFQVCKFHLWKWSGQRLLDTFLITSHEKAIYLDPSTATNVHIQKRRAYIEPLLCQRIWFEHRNLILIQIEIPAQSGHLAASRSLQGRTFTRSDGAFLNDPIQPHWRVSATVCNRWLLLSPGFNANNRTTGLLGFCFFFSNVRR